MPVPVRLLLSPLWWNREPVVESAALSVISCLSRFVVDERGLLERQDVLITPELAPDKNWVKPDFTGYTRSGEPAFYADAKTGTSIPFDLQARGFIDWSATSVSRTLIYYTPDGQSQIDQRLLLYARQQGVRVKQVGVP
jgi:hypothetical protein